LRKRIDDHHFPHEQSSLAHAQLTSVASHVDVGASLPLLVRMCASAEVAPDVVVIALRLTSNVVIARKAATRDGEAAQLPEQRFAPRMSGTGRLRQSRVLA
jgi:hypothetical protein